MAKLVLDKVVWDSYDVLSDCRTGFLMALLIAFKLSFGGMGLIALKCSSFIWMSRGSTQRSLGEPMGRDQTIQSVVDSNCLAARSALLMYIIHVGMSLLLLENPKGSLVEATRRIQEFFGS